MLIFYFYFRNSNSWCQITNEKRNFESNWGCQRSVDQQPPPGEEGVQDADPGSLQPPQQQQGEAPQQHQDHWRHHWSSVPAKRWNWEPGRLIIDKYVLESSLTNNFLRRLLMCHPATQMTRVLDIPQPPRGCDTFLGRTETCHPLTRVTPPVPPAKCDSILLRPLIKQTVMKNCFYEHWHKSRSYYKNIL